MLYIALIETSGNQHYIFSTNKLRENLGASELTRNAGESWVIGTVQNITGQPLPGLSLNPEIIHTPEQQREALKAQPSLFDPPSSNSAAPAVEIILAASGKALLLTREENTARRIIQALTTKALKKAPGLDLCGAILPFNPEDFTNPEKLAKIPFDERFNTLLRNIHERHAYLHAKGPGNAARFLRLPIIANCQTSSLPAQALHPEPGDNNSHTPRSAVSLAKDNSTVRETTRKRLSALLQMGAINQENWQFPINPSELEQTLNQSDVENSWLAVVHADGNGLGQIFLNFATHLENLNKTVNPEKQADANPAPLTLKQAFSHLREFSIELDCCTEKAFRSALLNTFKHHTFPNPQHRCLPIVPLILGGDDLTVLCDGRKALTFTSSFLKAFEAETADSKIVADIATAALKKSNLSACAGIAIIKPHFPFSIAYQLAESLIKSAKTVKQKIQHATATDTRPDPYPSSALDFHILYDSSNVSLKAIREKLTLKGPLGTATLTNKPYVVSPTTIPTDIREQDQNWLQQHKWQDFTQAIAEVKTFQQKDKKSPSAPANNTKKNTLPRSQAYGLRQTLFQGIGPTDAYLKMLTARYGLDPEHHSLLHGSKEAPSLFQLASQHSTDRNYDTGDTPSTENESNPEDIYLTNYLDALDAAEFL